MKNERSRTGFMWTLFSIAHMCILVSSVVAQDASPHKSAFKTERSHHTKGFAPSDKTLVITGSGHIQAEPDAFELTVVLEEKGPVVAKLQQKMKSRVEQIVDFLLSEGILPSHIQSMNVNLYPWFENTREGRTQQGIVLSRRISINGTDINKYDTILDGILKRGVERLERFQFVNSAPKELADKALMLAITDAKASAEMIAQQLGVEIVGVQQINRLGGQSGSTPAFRAKTMESASSSLPGTVDIQSSIQITFLIKPYTRSKNKEYE